MEILAEKLSELIECVGYHDSAPKWGERAWIARGEYANVVYWDTGNSWCDIMHVFVKKGGKAWLKKFFKEVTRYNCVEYDF